MPSPWFRIDYAENAFRRHLARPVGGLRAPDALAAAVAFYRDARGQHARGHDRADALLWQWGPAADGGSFTVDLTRQLIREHEEAITHLVLTLGFRWTPARRELGRGQLWCDGPEGLADFERAVRHSPAYRAVVSAAPSSSALRTELL